MAKKTVASLQKGEGRTYSKVIKMVKSPKTGAYTFQEEMVPNDAVKDVYEMCKEVFFYHDNFIALHIHRVAAYSYFS